jgi:hypothetical protein
MITSLLDIERRSRDHLNALTDHALRFLEEWNLRRRPRPARPALVAVPVRDGRLTAEQPTLLSQRRLSLGARAGERW